MKRSGIFDVDGKFYTVTSKIVDMVVLTLMWIVGCIPVVTILTSTSSMYYAVVKCIRYDRGKAYEEFIGAYKKNLKQGIGLTLLYGGIGAAIAFMDYEVFFISQSRTEAMLIWSVGMLILTVLYGMNALWLIPVFSRFSNTFGKILQLNFTISVRFLFRSILMLLIFAAAVLCILASFPLAVIVPALSMLVLSYPAEPGLWRYMPVQEENNGDWRYGCR